MDADAHLSFLFSILPPYMKRRSEAYVVSRMLRYMKAEGVFISEEDRLKVCFTCRAVFVPAVNCSVALEERGISLECWKCKTRLYVEKSSKNKVQPAARFRKTGFSKSALTIEDFLK